MDKIKSSFDEIAHKYDKQREQFIPCYNDFYQSIVTLIDIAKPNLRILDVGAGTGLLSNFIIQKFPEAQYTLIDFSEEMLAVAKERFSGRPNFTYVVSDYKDLSVDQKFDVIASSLSIHHLTDEEKFEFYKHVYNSLTPGGLFINGDLFLGRSEHTNEINQKVWFSKIDTSSLSEEDRKAGYYRMTFDKPSTVETALSALVSIGFKDVDLFYKYFRFGVIRGTK